MAADIRLAAGSAGGEHSSIWRVWAQGARFTLLSRGMGGDIKVSLRACVKAGLGCRIKNVAGVLVYVGKHFYDFRRIAARNMIRAGVPQSVAMRVTGHDTDAIFQRYDITDNRDKLTTLEAARRFADQTPDLRELVVSIRN